MTRLTDAAGRRWALVLALLALALFMTGIDAKSIWWDESLSLFRAQRSVSYILSNRLNIGMALTIDQHPPFYFILLHGAIRLFGESDLALRLPSALAAALTVPLLYALGKRLANAQIGLLAALWGALSPLYLWYAQEVRMYTLVTALGATGTYALWRAIDKGKATWAAAYVATIALGLGSLYFYGLLIGVQVLFGLALLAGKRRLRLGSLPRWTMIVGGIALFVLGALLAWLAPPQIRSLLHDPLPGRYYVSFDAMLLDAMHAFSLGLSVDPATIWPGQLLYLFTYLLGLVAAWQWVPPSARSFERWTTRAALLVLLVGFPVLPLLFFWLVSLYKPIYMGSRYITLFSPSFYLGLALGVAFLWKKSRLAGMALTITLAAGMLYSTVNYHTDPLYVKENYQAAAQHVLQQEVPGDGIVLTAPENLFAFRHYYEGHLGISPLPQPALALPDPVPLDRALRLLVGEHDRLWLVHCRTQWSDPDNLVLDWMNRHLHLLERTTYPSYGTDMTVYLYSARPPVNPPTDGLEPLATCDERLALVDWSARYLDAQGSPVALSRRALDTGEAKAAAPGGGAIAVRLRWQVLAPLEGYKLSLRLVDQAGRTWAQHDDRPIYYWPTETWEVGSVMEHDLSITVPVGAPAGLYTLMMVPYREDDVQVLSCSPMENEGAPLRLGQFPIGATPAHLSPPPRGLAPREHRLAWPRALGPLRLVGRTLAMPPEGAVSPGQRLDIALWWLAEADFHGEYDLIIHWIQGRTVVHREIFPFHGQEAQEGMPLLTRQQITVAETLPPGDYMVRLLLYDRREGMFPGVRWGPLPWFGSSLGLGSVPVQ